MSTAGAANLATAAIALIVACVELVSLRGSLHTRARSIASGTALFASLYAFIGWYHYDFVSELGVVWLVRVEFALIAIMTLSLGAYASLRTGARDAKWWWRIGLSIVASILLTPWVVRDEVRWMDVAWAGRPYPQPPDSVFSLGLFAFGASVVLWSIVRVFRHRPHLPERVPYTLGLLFWLLTGVIDACFAEGLIAMPVFLMEFGFVGFAFAMMLAHTSEHMRLLAEAGEEQALLLHEREAAIAASVENELISRSIVESVSDGLVVLDGAGAVTLWNSVVEQLLGVPEAEALGKSLAEQLPLGQADRSALEEAIRTALMRGERGELVLVMDTRSIRAVVSPHRGLDGSARGVVVALRDITTERTLSTRMAHLDRMAALGTLAASVGHEINNPLASLQLNIDFLITELTKSEGRESEACLVARDVAMGAQRIAAIVAELKALSRSRRPGEAQAVRLEEVASWAARTARHAIQHRAQLVVDMEELPLARGDAGQLGQVLLNLLLNASNAIPEGAAAQNCITVRGFVEDDNVVIEVEDTGSGIEQAILDRIFEPFFTTRPDDGGTGLGLAISADVVRSAGGTLSVSSEVGIGTTFRMALPIVGEGEADSGDALDELVDRLDGVSIAVLDDDEAFLRALQRRLSGLGAWVRVTSDPGELLEWAAQGLTGDVVLCDIMMPRLSGVEVFRRLHEVSPTVADRVLFVSGGSVTEEARRFVEEYPDRVLAKPVRYRVLAERIRAMTASTPPN